MCSSTPPSLDNISIKYSSSVIFAFIAIFPPSHYLQTLSPEMHVPIGKIFLGGIIYLFKLYPLSSGRDEKIPLTLISYTELSQLIMYLVIHSTIFRRKIVNSLPNICLTQIFVVLRSYFGLHFQILLPLHS